MFCCTCAESGQVVEAEVEAASASASKGGEVVPDVIFTTPIKEEAEPAAEVEQPAAEPEVASPSSGGKTLQVLVLGARNLRNADLMPGTGKSDSFVIVEAAGKSFQTLVIKDCLQPVWSFEGELAGVPEGSDITFVVWDQDPVGKDLLGRAKLTAAEYEAEGFNGELALEDVGAPIKSYLRVKVKPPGKEYPKGAGSQFTITLEKPASASLGLDIDLLDGSKLQVSNIKPGVLATWNETAPPELKVPTGSYIIDVNGVSGAPAAMIGKLKEDTTLKLTLRRAQEFPIQIVKKNGQLGLDLNYAASGVTLLILKVGEGPVAEWNEANKEFAVQKHDRIIAVNDVTGTSKELHEAIKASEKLRLLISRPAADDWWVHQ